TDHPRSLNSIQDSKCFIPPEYTGDEDHQPLEWKSHHHQREAQYPEELESSAPRTSEASNDGNTPNSLS
ncbi:MAG: hypothetical protein ABIK28_06105, partial [Planctomycetota bacterium]